MTNTDINKTWLDETLPPSAIPYAQLARWDRPIGTWLLLFPCWWGIVLAPGSVAYKLFLMLLFAIGAIVMRGAGCTINDIADAKLDALVERTRVRPIPSGKVSITKAIVFAIAQMLIGFVILVQLPKMVIFLGLISLLLLFSYPFMKRITWWPQLFLGLTFNWGALMGWAAVTEMLSWKPIVLYLACIFWTLGYDTIYAHQDKEDDIAAGIKSSAIKLGEATKTWLVGFYSVVMVILAFILYREGSELVSFLFLAAAWAQLMWQAFTVDISNPSDCLSKFRSNRWVGWLVLGALVMG